MNRETRSSLLMLDLKDECCRIRGKQWKAMCSIIENFLE